MARRRNYPGGIGPADVEGALSALQRLDPRARMILLVVLVLAVLAALIFLSRSPQTPQTQPSASVLDNMLLGNPSGATADPANKNNYLMAKKYFVLSYNNDGGIPNWVSWRVAASDLGKAPRKLVFDPDGDLPPGFKRVLTADYTGSGFDRGHMCPHSDRAATQEMSYATFVMTNIIPQAPDVNRKAWEQLEAYARELVQRQHRRLYIVAGPAGKGGRGDKGQRDTLANGKVTVPAECWKIIVSVPEAGDDDLAKITPATRVIAVVMPNESGVGFDWAKFRTRPADIERRTEYRFFDRVPSNVADALRQKLDSEPITQPQPTRGGED